LPRKNRETKNRERVVYRAEEKNGPDGAIHIQLCKNLITQNQGLSILANKWVLKQERLRLRIEEYLL
jgi:hypothetical protein